MNAPTDLPKFRSKKDRVGRIHTRTVNAAPSAARFRKLQKEFAQGKWVCRSAESKVVLCFSLFEGVVDRESIEALLRETPNRYSIGDQIAVEFVVSHGLLDRRFLSAFTLFAISNLSTSNIDVGKALCDLELDLEKVYPTVAEGRLEVLLRDGRSWLFEVCAGPLFFHCSRDVILTPFPRSALARRESKLAIGFETTQEVSIEEGVATALAIERYFDSNLGDRSTVFLQRIEQACRAKQKANPITEKRRMLAECLSQISEARSLGPVESLLAGWVADLIESGTRYTPNLSPLTPSAYVRPVLLPLFQSLRGRNVEQLTEDEFTSIYKKIIDSVNPGVRGTCKAALASFHYFLESWIDVPSVQGFRHWAPETAQVSANSIWQHEVNTILRWLGDATGDPRLNEQLKVILPLLAEVRMRAGDLYSLAMCSVRLGEHCVELDIAPGRGDPRLKSKSAWRTIQVQNQAVCSVLREWVSRRNAESAFPNDKLFGDPRNPSHWYRWGATYCRINRVLKTVSGDNSVSLHTFSHGYITREIESALVASHAADLNHLEFIAVQAGHASIQTSLIHYFHSYEWPIREYLDRQLRKIPLSSRVLGVLSGKSAEAVRKQRSRSASQEVREIDWDLIKQGVGAKISDVSVVGGLHAYEPKAPGWLKGEQQWSLLDVVGVLQDIAVGLGVDTVALRVRRTENEIRQLAEHAIGVLEKLQAFDDESEVLGQDKSIFQLNRFAVSQRRIDFVRIKQAKHDSLLHYLSINCGTALVVEGVWSWLNCFKKGYLGLQKPARAEGLVRILFSAGVPLDQVAIFAERTITEESHVLRQLRMIFSTVYGHTPLIEPLSPRRGRPSIYLVISSQPLVYQGKRESAATSPAGLNALFLSAAVWLRALQQVEATRELAMKMRGHSNE